MFAGRRNGDKLEPLVKEIEAAGGRVFTPGRSMRARKRRSSPFLGEADKHAPLEVCIFNVGANVNFPILDTTERVFRKVWEMACYSGFLAGREAARLMLPRGKGNIFFTGATASLRGGSGYAAFASAKFGLRAVGAVDGARTGAEEHPCRPSRHRFRRRHRMGASAADRGVGPACARQSRSQSPDAAVAVAESYWQLYQQPRRRLDLRAWKYAPSARSGKSTFAMAGRDRAIREISH